MKEDLVKKSKCCLSLYTQTAKTRNKKSLFTVEQQQEEIKTLKFDYEEVRDDAIKLHSDLEKANERIKFIECLLSTKQ